MPIDRMAGKALYFCQMAAGLYTFHLNIYNGPLPSSKTLTFKIRPSAEPFLWKWVPFAWEWKINSTSKTEHVTSFWYKGPEKLGNGLLNRLSEKSLLFFYSFSLKSYVTKSNVLYNVMTLFTMTRQQYLSSLDCRS